MFMEGNLDASADKKFMAFDLETTVDKIEKKYLRPPWIEWIRKKENKLAWDLETTMEKLDNINCYQEDEGLQQTTI